MSAGYVKQTVRDSPKIPSDLIIGPKRRPRQGPMSLEQPIGRQRTEPADSGLARALAVPEHMNYLINPNHPSFAGAVETGEVFDLFLDD